MSKPVLTIHNPKLFSPIAMARLKESFRIVSDWRWFTNVLWLRLDKFEGDHFNRFKDLWAIATNCTGIDHIDLEECKRRGIEVLSLKGIEGLDNVHATAEHTISLMLQALRYRADRSSGRIGRELRGKLVCLVGFGGRIAYQVNDILKCFDALRIRVSKNGKDQFDLFAGDCDIVSLHVPLNDETRGMVNAEFLSKLKPGCILVNTARHAIVDEKAILDWLDRDKEAIYAHDFGDEWPPRSFEYLKRNIISTPHIGGWTIESLHKTEELLAEKVIEWARNHAEQASTVSSVR